MGSEQAAVRSRRIQSIDMMRGICIIIMVIGHTRASLGKYAEMAFGAATMLPEPTDLAVARPIMFLMRLISHPAAVAFIFLAGVSVYLWQKKYGESRSLTRYLFLRGLALIGINFILNTTGLFSGHFSTSLHVLWAIGFGMLLMIIFARLPKPVLWLLSIAILCGHNALTGLSFSSPLLEAVWKILFLYDSVALPGGGAIYLPFPTMPWVVMMMLGYLCGGLFTLDKNRIRIFMMTGLACMAAFLVLRYFRCYGDPDPWLTYQETWKTIASFFNIEKYPPSLQFSLFSFACVFWGLAFLERYKIAIPSVILLGNESLLMYFGHLVILKAVPRILSLINNDWTAAAFPYVFTLKGTFVYSALIIAALYPCCVLLQSRKAAKRKAIRSA